MDDFRRLLMALEKERAELRASVFEQTPADYPAFRHMVGRDQQLGRTIETLKKLAKEDDET